MTELTVQLTQTPKKGEVIKLPIGKNPPKLPPSINFNPQKDKVANDKSSSS